MMPLFLTFLRHEFLMAGVETTLVKGTVPGYSNLGDYDTQAAIRRSMETLNEDEEARAEETRQLNLYLRQFNVTVIEESLMPWDGDCWFHCLSWFHGEARTTENAKRYRAAVVQFLIDHIDDYIPFCDDGKGNIITKKAYYASCNYLKRKYTYNTKTTVGDIVPMAIAARYGVYITVYDPKLKEPQTIGDNMSTRFLTVGKITTSRCEHIQGVVPLMS